MSRDFQYSALQEYLRGLEPPRHAVMTEMEAYAEENDFPIIGAISGHWMALLAQLTGARTVFELGSGYGYSTAWFAQALEANGGGEIWHTIWDDDLSAKAEQSLGAMGFNSESSNVKINFLRGEAVGLLKGEPGPFDIVFMDIDKTGYPGALPEIERKLRPGGLLLVDNMLWDGRALDPANNEPETLAIRELTSAVYESPRWDACLLPVRDGLLTAMLR